MEGNDLFSSFNPPAVFAPINPEEQIIGIFLLHPDLLEDYPTLLVDDFSNRLNQKIFKCILLFHQQKREINFITISEELLKKDPGEPYLELLVRWVREAFSPRSLKHYIETIKNKKRDKKLLEIAERIIVNVQQDVENRIEIAQHQLTDLILEEPTLFSMRKDLIAQVLQEISDRGEGGIKGIPTGFIDLDNLTQGLQNGDLIILAARPSIGKTTLALNIADHIAYTLHQGVLFFSLEMNKNQLIERSLCSLGTILAINMQSGKLTTDDYQKISKLLEKMQQDELVIDDRSALYVREMRASARKLQKEGKLSLIIVDHLGFISGEGENETLKLGAITRELKCLARDLQIPVLVLCQLNRSVEHRNNKRPTLSDLRQSGRIEEDADLVMMLYRDEYYDEHSTMKGIGELIITKHRNGAVGTLYLAFQGQYCRFLNLSSNYASPQSTKPIKAPRRDYFEY